MILPQPSGRVNVFVPRRVVTSNRVGHRCRIGPIKSSTTQDQTDGFSMLDACFVYLFIAEPPGNARGPRKFVFDEFRWDQGLHVDTILRGVDEQSTISKEFRHRDASGRLPGVQAAPGHSD